MEERAMDDADPINPAARLLRALASGCPTGAILSVGLRLGGELVRARRADPRRDDGLALGQPRDDGARACRTRSRPSSRIPDRPVDRAGRRRRVPDERHERADHDRASTGTRWPDPRLIVLVLHNNDLNQVTWEQRVMEGDPKFDASQELPDFPYARVRRVGRAARASASTTRPRSAPPGTRRSRADRPVVLEPITDPEVPPLPPHITFEQAVQLRRVGRRTATPAAAG